jgi:hypothetical protein
VPLRVQLRPGGLEPKTALIVVDPQKGIGSFRAVHPIVPANRKKSFCFFFQKEALSSL